MPVNAAMATGWLTSPSVPIGRPGRCSALIAKEGASAVLSVEIFEDGGIRIEGTARDLRELADHLCLAVYYGQVNAAFVTDEALTCIEILTLD